MRHKPEDLLVHGDDLSGRRRLSWQGRSAGEGSAAYLIVPEEPSVEGGATIFVKEVGESLEDVVAFERLEHAEDDIEIPGPATAYAGDWLGA